ncbi:small acid-soluble spore protein SspI [Pueribacillus theae]|uniref:Small, acid-soluble spore protein I n=1 Tax=Pueribacillus theae TaxID=2171751 RepID=A0A2U1K467_9BACI|nr:small acid-soluble spore protein SspI [Pueribacillus theae]PWA12311.1 small acid-soluble spore protein SspI [Pueribacillus theae]
MDFNLRQAILNNVKGSDEAQLEHTIVDAIQSGEEKMLPGLGVLFEVLWKNSDQNEQRELLKNMAEGLQ